VLADGLQLALQREDDIGEVDIAGTVAEAVRLATQYRPTVVLMDFHLPDGTGADAAQRILALVQSTAVVMLTAETGDEAIGLSIAAGATGYLPKSLAARHVVEAVRRAAAGEVVLPIGMLARALEHAKRASQRRVQALETGAQLTPREREVLMLLGQGLDNRVIAERLGVAYSTVRTHVQALIEKLGARSRLEAVAKASAAGLFDT